MCRKHYVKKTNSTHDKRQAIVVGTVARIPLGLDAKDGYALVDAAEVHLASINWVKNSNGYAVGGKNGKVVYLHRLIMADELNSHSQPMLVDHKNQDKLDNRRCNLRVVNKSANQINCKQRTSNTSGYRGVHYDKSRDKWLALIAVNNNNYHLGRFDTKEAAALVYNKKAKELHGEFAVLNQV